MAKVNKGVKSEVVGCSENTDNTESSAVAGGRADADKDTGSDAKPGVSEDAPSHESNLEFIGLSRKDKLAARKKQFHEATDGMSTKDKLIYFITYYKWYVLGPIIAIALIIYVASTIYQNKQPIALAYAILNVEDPDSIDNSFEADFTAYFNYADNYRCIMTSGIDIDYEYFKENEAFITTSNSTDYNLLQSSSELGDYDVIITNKAGLKYCSIEQVTKPLEGYFDSTVFAALKDYMYESENFAEVLVPYAIDISDTEFAKSLNLGYSDVYIAFPGASSQNNKNAKRLLEYIFNISLED